MLRNSFHGVAGAGPSDVVAFGGNMRRKSLVISYAGGGALIVAFGRTTNSGSDFDIMVTQSNSPVTLTVNEVGDSIHDEVHLWNSAGGQPVSAVEFFSP